MSDLIEKHKVAFEGIKHTDDDGVEFWHAKELSKERKKLALNQTLKKKTIFAAWRKWFN